MAKADLLKLANKAIDHLKNSKDLRKISDRQPHIFLIDKDNIFRQILVQISRKRPLTDKQFDELNASIDNYVNDLYGTFKNRVSKEYMYKVFGSPPSFKVLVTSKTGTGDVFRKIREIRSSRRNELKLTKSISEIFSRDNSITEESLSHLFDLGHVEGSSIAEQRIQSALSKFTKVNTSGINSPELDTIINLAISSKHIRDNQKVGKNFIITVADESFSANQLKGSQQEKDLIAKTESLLSEFVNNNIDWSNQKGSMSTKDIIYNEIMNSAVKSGAKTKRAKQSVESKQKATVKTRIKSSRIKTVDNLDSEKVNISKKKPSTQQTKNWLALLPVINARLIPKVLANMKAPALVNRTGTFAQSVKITNIEQTREGYPSFVFDYERDPYDVFDRTKGRAPWNTPQRDPRALVDKSVREVVREMAINRFYTRRA